MNLTADDRKKMESGDAYTVYVEGIPYSCEEEELWDVFRALGPVRDLRLPRWHDSNKLKGYAHVDFDSEQGFNKALEMDGYEIKGRYLKITQAKQKRKRSVHRADRPRVPDGCKTLFVKNLPYEIEEAEVKKSFAKFGEVVNVRIARWNHTRRAKGFGYVQFDSTNAIERALQANEPVYVGDRMVTIDPDTGTPKSSFRDASGRQWSKVEGKNLSHQTKKRKKSSSLPIGPIRKRA